MSGIADAPKNNTITKKYLSKKSLYLCEIMHIWEIPVFCASPCPLVTVAVSMEVSMAYGQEDPLLDSGTAGSEGPAVK